MINLEKYDKVITEKGAYSMHKDLAYFNPDMAHVGGSWISCIAVQCFKRIYGYYKPVDMFIVVDDEIVTHKFYKSLSADRGAW